MWFTVDKLYDFRQQIGASNIFGTSQLGSSIHNFLGHRDDDYTTLENEIVSLNRYLYFKMAVLGFLSGVVVNLLIFKSKSEQI